MSDRLRAGLVLAPLAVLAGLFVWAVSGLPHFGRYAHAYGRVLNHVAPTERGTTDVVTAVVFDYRGVDTMGEELILLTAATGCTLLLREMRDDGSEPTTDVALGESVRVAGVLLPPVFVLVGLYVVAHGYVTPGGGFQGGVVLAAALVMVYLGGRYGAYRRVSPQPLVEAGEGGGALIYIAVGLLALALGEAFLQNLLGSGTSGTLLSGGSIPILNWAVGLEVAGAFVLLFHEFAEDLHSRRPR